MKISRLTSPRSQRTLSRAEKSAVFPAAFCTVRNRMRAADQRKIAFSVSALTRWSRKLLPYHLSFCCFYGSRVLERYSRYQPITFLSVAFMAAEFFYIFAPAAFSEGVEKIYTPFPIRSPHKFRVKKTQKNHRQNTWK